MKNCNTCKKIQDKSCFGSNRANADGLKYKCKICCIDYNNAWNSKNPEKVAKYANNWNKKNPNYLNAAREFRYKTDGNYRASVKIRLSVGNAIRRGGKPKKGKAKDYLGCSPKFAREYLAGLFVNGMSWDNYGLWEIDHIKPLAAFDKTVSGWEFEACNYKNLQPLWRADNLKKGKKFTDIRV